MCSARKSTEDDAFVELFRKEHNEQFYVLVKMHLSFLLHMTTEESECFYEKAKLKKWNLVPFGKKSKRNLTEGLSLSPENILQMKRLIEYLGQEQNVSTDGIFRRTGSIERQQELKNLLMQGAVIELKNSHYSVHDTASVLKGFLADLPEPLLTDSHFPVYCQIAESCKLNQETKMLQAIQLLIIMLPKENSDLLYDILELLFAVTEHKEKNRMTAENLAKLFTPHLLCPRKLPPETLLKDSEVFFSIISFMIQRFRDIFKVPSQLMLDLRTHYEQANVLNESIKGAAHTVFTFVDNKLTAKENEENPTETALAQLYAHIQSLPESSKKKKLIKQFNKENGQGTPLQVVRSSMPIKNKSIGDSIKKHMFHTKLMRNMRKTGAVHLKKSSSEEVLNSPHSGKTVPGTRRLFCHNFDSSNDEDQNFDAINRSDRSRGSVRRSKSDSSITESPLRDYLTSTPAHLCQRTGEAFTPNCQGQDRESMSPITRSAQRMPRAMQETMMTPRSRKPVLLVSGTNINNLAKVEPKLPKMDHLSEETPEESLTESKRVFQKSKSDGDITSEAKAKVPKLNQTDTPHSLTGTFREYLESREMITMSSPADSNFSSRTDDFNSFEFSNDKISDSMMYILDGNDPKSDDEEVCEKELVLKPRQFDKDGKPIVFETSF